MVTNSGQISPPNTSLGSVSGQQVIIAPEWYRYLVIRQATSDGTVDSSVITADPQQSVFPNSRQLTVKAGELTETTGASSIQLGLANTAVTAGSYGDASHVLVLTIDGKGRITNAATAKVSVADVDGTLAATHGGTGLTGYAIGDLLYANTATTLAKLPDVALGNVLRSGGVGVAPAWGKVNVTTDVTGGFTGTGTYTNFTIVNGIITAAS